MGTYDDSDFDDLIDGDLYRNSSTGRFGRAPSRATTHMFRVLSWALVGGQIDAEDPKYFGILHEWKAIQFGMLQASKGLCVTVCKCPTLEAMDRRAGLKTTTIWKSSPR